MSRLAVSDWKATRLDNVGNKSHNIGELMHVNIEVSQLVFECFVGHDLGALAHSAQTP